MSAPPTAAVRCDNVVHVYGDVGVEVVALRGVDLEVESGEMVAVLGPSGSGKSTLLWLLAGLLRPTAGEMVVYGRRLGNQDEAALARMRSQEIGVLLQNPSRNVLGYASVLDNVMFSQKTTKRSRKDKQKRAHELLDEVGIGALAHARAGSVSGGEQQRLALAVALANGPRLLLADEPTSQLDQESAVAVIDLMQSASNKLGTTVIMVTHDPVAAAAMGRTVTIRDGRIGSEGRAGRELVVIGRDGGVHLPNDVLDLLPPGSLAQVIRTGNGVELRRADPDLESVQGEQIGQEDDT